MSPNDRLGHLYDELETPIGTVALVADERGILRALGFVEAHPRMAQDLAFIVRSEATSLRRVPNPFGITAALASYFRGDLRAIDALSVGLDGTEFQRAVWAELTRIPCGETISYGELARRIGRESAVRAVGLANRANPVGIVVPCHRVIGADGRLVGYGAGVDRKRWLLAHEGAAVA